MMVVDAQPQLESGQIDAFTVPARAWLFGHHVHQISKIRGPISNARERPGLPSPMRGPIVIVDANGCPRVYPSSEKTKLLAV